MVTVEEAAQQISKLLPKLISGIKNSFLTSSNITSSQMIILMHLSEFKKCSVSRLATVLGVSLPTISGIVDRLVKAKYMIRSYDEKDRRLVLLALTKKGEFIIDRFLDTVRQRWSEVLIYLSEDERESYVKILKKLIKIISEQNQNE